MSNPFKIGQKPIVQFQDEARAWDRYKCEMPHFFELASQKERWLLFIRLFYEEEVINVETR